ncbi:molybdopterin molybdotransferase MoeA [Arthrobacter sp. NIO-1057]|uniref:molybdopterin molybdotransferase MoeA n=1 Tax=Arthrobacter sp. NIO-1057 TaxID=993071 RepID=UPI00071D3946|nr:molybdopterin molybdotransferase MoeA [Arthrobacter sp. NIO-1057]KSU65696.1 molybdopterin biosynthesis protein MoeA [Arthrobacter sp. NIO-1057]SCC40865.1 molybdopterin molybdotransferase [Arthrobacter sp. NIO-1057]
MTCTLETHRAELVALLSPVFASLGSEVLPAGSVEASNRILSQDLYAQLPIPAFTNSQMDGYAARSADLAEATPGSPICLPLGFTAAAGDPQITLATGTVSPVMTGAMIPAGADTVIPVEESAAGSFPDLVRVHQGEPSGSAEFTAPSEPGRFIRTAGIDLEAGTLVAKAGTRLTPTMIAALVSSGLREVPVRRALKVAVCTTGDELSDDQRSQGQIPDSNSPMLTSWLHQYQIQVRTLQLPDDPARFALAIDALQEQVDLILTVGGISAGAYEVVRQALAPLGGTFHHVAIQPGGPQGFAQLAQAAVLCFPGNPVSALLSAELFLAPLLRQFNALPEPAPKSYPLAGDVTSPEHKHQVRRGVIKDGAVEILGPGSHLVHDLARADALVHIPIGVSKLSAGQQIETWSMNV